MSAIAIEIALILLLIVANGIFSGSEIAVVAARKIRLEQLANRGNRQAKIALKLVNSPNDFLSTVQIGITLIGILSGAVGGATVAQRLKPVFDNFSALQAYSEGLSVAIVVTIIAYLSLVVGELVPKRIALNAPENIACTVAKPMRFLARLTAPLVQILSISTNALLKLMGIRASNEPEITEEEIKVLIKQGAESGMFEESEKEMVERVFRLGDRSIKAFMTPRTETIWLELESSLEENIQKVMGSIYSRFPVGRGSLDNCVGIVRGSSLLSARLSGQDVTLEAILQPPLYVAESTRTLNVLEQFKQTGIHLALITDEYGGIEGLVTLNDLMEAIVGNISSVENAEEQDIVQREDGSWLVDGLILIDRVKDLLNCESLPKEETGRYHTLGGFALNFLGHIPRTGEHFEWDGFQFEIVDMDGQRIDKVLITPPQKNR
jgi:putative hemolysin